MNATTQHLTFLVVCVSITVIVGRTLFRCGRPFVIECVHGDERLADSANRLMLAGYYLLNLGLIALAVRFGNTGDTLLDSVESLANKIGWILAIQGVMHCVNMIVLSEMRRRKQNQAVEILEFLD